MAAQGFKWPKCYGCMDQWCIWNSRSCPVVHTYCTKSSLRWTTSKTSDDLRSCWCVQRAKGKLCSSILQKSDCSTGSTIAAKPSLRCWKIPQGNWKKDKATTNSCMKYDTLGGFTELSSWTFCQIKLKLVQDLGLCCVTLCRHLSENWMCLIELLLQLFLGLFSWFIYFIEQDVIIATRNCFENNLISQFSINIFIYYFILAAFKPLTQQLLHHPQPQLHHKSPHKNILFKRKC